MILGHDAAKRVPEEFITQRVNIANPPTLLLVLEKLVNKYDSIEGQEEEEENQKKKKAVKMQAALAGYTRLYTSGSRGFAVTARGHMDRGGSLTRHARET